jgi:subtilisin family serine protease
LAGLLLTASALPGQSFKIDADLAVELSMPDTRIPFFVFLKGKADLSAVSRIPARAERARVVVAALQAAADAAQAPVRAFLKNSGVEFTPYWVENAVYVHAGDLMLARQLADRSEVERISAEPVFSIGDFTAGSALSSSDWNILTIRADQAWPTASGEGVVVAAIDSGVRYTHNALVNQYRGKDGSTFHHTGNWSDPTAKCGASPCDNTGHGTMVMGLIAGSDGGTNQIGVAPGAKWIACKGCATTKCSGSHLMACGQWVLDPMQDGSGSGQPDIVNNSWSSAGGDQWFQDMVRNWRAAGIFPVFAAGNSGPACGTVRSPGDYPESFGIGATDAVDLIANFSSRGPSLFGVMKPDLTAPGVNVRSADYYGNNLYYYGSGTSFAAPHVAGTVALMWSAAPGIKSDLALTEQLLRETAQPLLTSETCGNTLPDQTPNNTYGSGRVDAFAAVEAARGVLPPAPIASNDSYEVATNGNLVVAAPGVLANDTGTNLMAGLVSGPAHGTLQLNSDGSFSFAPQTDFSGSDQFTYQALGEGGNGSNTATVIIAVLPANQPPVAVNDSATTKKNTNVTINVVANDTDPEGLLVPSSAAIAVNPSKGSVVNNGNGTFTYSPKRNFTGSDSFTYTVKDNAGAVSNAATVQVSVTK